MALIPVYIMGRKGFQESVTKKLEAAWIQGGTDGELALLMYWLPDGQSIRELKISIGSKLILKYRVHFFTDLNLHLNEIVDRREARAKSDNGVKLKAVVQEYLKRRSSVKCQGSNNNCLSGNTG